VTEPYKLAVIGLGEMGQAHARIIAGLEHARLTAVAEPNPERRGIGQAIGAERVYSDYREMLGTADIDGVVIATPDQAHVEPCLAAAAAGKAILVEKPIATTEADSIRIIEACREAGVMLMVGHVLRYFPEYVEAKRVVSEGALGRLVSLFARRTNLITQQDRLGGRVGVLMFLGVHDFDVLRWIGGAEPVRIFCESASSAPGPYGVENETFTTVSFAGGSIGCVHAGWYLPKSHPAGFDFKLDVTGDKGVINLDFARHVTTQYGESGSRYPLMTSAVADQMCSFIKAASRKEPSPISGEEGLIALRMALAAGASIRTGQPVTL
jgi:UDP-N-acetylglucosamine 3-dehydrogenase